MPNFTDLPKGTQLRLAAQAVLKAAGTLAGPRVFDSRIDPLGEADMPAIIVTSAESRQTMSAAGGAATFRVDYTLRLQGVVISANEIQAVVQADVLRGQMLDGLLGDPVWPGLLEAIGAVEHSEFTTNTEARFERQTVITLHSAFREKYVHRPTSVLLPGGEPATWRDVIVPLTTIENTIRLPSGDEFVAETAIPQS
jgi:hypothetical protein